MSLSKMKIEGGQGGRLGHSNMSHWDYTEVIKAACRRLRRAQGKKLIRNELKEYSSEQYVRVSAERADKLR